MIYEVTIDDSAAEHPLFGSILQKLRAAEHREAMSQEFFQSLDIAELTTLQEDEEIVVLTTIALKSIFFAEDPTSMQASIDEDTLPEECGSVMVIAALENLMRTGDIKTDGGYFYNPFSDDENTARFLKPDSPLESFEERMTRMMGE
jgi:hypothetical protein